jgi:hypothetical protein
MPEQKLDLLQFSTGEMTQAGAAASEVVGGQVCDAGTPGSLGGHFKTGQ